MLDGKGSGFRRKNITEKSQKSTEIKPPNSGHQVGEKNQTSDEAIQGSVFYLLSERSVGHRILRVAKIDSVSLSLYLVINGSRGFTQIECAADHRGLMQISLIKISVNLRGPYPRNLREMYLT